MISLIKTFLASNLAKELLKVVARQTFPVLILLGGLVYLGNQNQAFQIQERERNQQLIDCYQQVIESVGKLESTIIKLHEK